MQFRLTKTTYRGEVRQYGQIVESYRRESDGMPTHRLIASLGRVTDEQAANFKAAFAASRKGAQVHVVDEELIARIARPPAWTRDLGDIATCLQAWQDCGLQALLYDLFAGHGEDVEPADVVAALVVQRLVAPDSKLAACRWFPDTALPDLLGIAPAKLHNTRVHRVLERLEACEEDLQNALSSKLLSADGTGCRAFFIDVTDTWFTGRGPAMAERGKTKEEFYRKKVGIVLLCRQDGMPLRFKVIRGNTDDGVAMLGMLHAMGAEAWLGTAPVVCDRALGNTADLLDLSDMGLQFVTALVANEHAAYGATLACPALATVDHKALHSLDKAGAAVVQAGMTRHADDLYLLDLSVVQKHDADRAAVADALGGLIRSPRQRGDDLARDMLNQARKYRKAVTSGKVQNYQVLQRGLGRSNGHMHRFLSLLKLPAEIQEQIDRGVGSRLSKKALVRICKGADDAAKAFAFAEECAVAGGKRSARLPAMQAPNDATCPWVQLVLVFNPQIWKFKREKAEERIVQLSAAVARQNELLVVKPTSRALSVSKIEWEIKKLKLSSVYQIAAGCRESGILSVVRDDEKWQKLRRRDGFHVIASSPDVNLTALERVKLYRSKDRIEKDFKEIKSVLDLRPVRHRTDAKVRAHVTLCVLALAVERWMAQRLLQAGHKESATAALEELRNIRLCGIEMPESNKIIAMPNATTPARQALARALGAEWALKSETLKERLKK